jgi:hypothetical protein
MLHDSDQAEAMRGLGMMKVKQLEFDEGLFWMDRAVKLMGDDVSFYERGTVRLEAAEYMRKQGRDSGLYRAGAREDLQQIKPESKHYERAQKLLKEWFSPPK